MNDNVSPCFSCGNALRNAFPSDDEGFNQPLGGTMFIADGHYGSVFDPMDSRLQIQINVCDGCLTSPDNKGVRLYRTECEEPRRVSVPIPPNWRIG